MYGNVSCQFIHTEPVSRITLVQASVLMDRRLPAAIAEEWIRVWSSPEPPVDEGMGTSRLDGELPREEPQLCLESILEVLARIEGASSNRLLAALAAGPLEDLLTKNGHIVIEQVEVLARRNPDFRLLLNGIWDSTIKPEVLSRLAKYRSRQW
jgi:hypothetical protein